MGRGVVMVEGRVAGAARRICGLACSRFGLVPCCWWDGADGKARRYRYDAKPEFAERTKGRMSRCFEAESPGSSGRAVSFRTRQRAIYVSRELGPW